jgi:signal transduction histidine kinase
VNTLLERTFETAADERLEQALRGGRHEVERRRRQAREAVLSAAGELPLMVPSDESDPAAALAEPLARGRSLDVLEIVDREGRLLSSHHWPAGYGLPDRDQLFGGLPDYRVEKVAEGHGAALRLAVTASAPGEWRARPVTVRGGYFVDAAFARELSSLTGLDLALYDQERRRWIAASGSALAGWARPPLPRDGAGETSLLGEPHRWRAVSLAPSLWLVAATPRRSLTALTSGVRLLGLGIAAAALLAAVAAGIVLSARIARPVEDLSEAARRVAEGDLGAPVPQGAPDEVGRLARTFEEMTGELLTSRERLLQAERVAAWREMARRLAHELKNPIFPIQLSIETLRRVLDQGEGAEADARFRALFRESSDTILEELRALRKIVDEFSQFARMPRPQPAVLDLSEVAEHALSLHRHRADGVRIETSFPPGLPPVRADRDLVGRALSNLLANALDAMPEGGVLRVRTSAGPAGVSVDVEDTGPGLTEEQRTRLFTPYFTTKKGGTGLGLAIVQGIVSDHGGRVQVASEPGAGTTFTLVFPAATADDPRRTHRE